MTDDSAPHPAPGRSTPVGIAALAQAASAIADAPVESWNPPYCGDIGLEIRADGTWFYQGTPINRMPLVHMFARVLRKDADGQIYLVTPAEKVLVRVADAPFLGVELGVEGVGTAQVIGVRTNLDTWVSVGHDHPLRFVTQTPTGGLKPYVLVRGRLEALLTRALFMELVALAEGLSDDPQQLGVWSRGTWWPLRDAG
jgi:uncharacterized protein